jgi:hypothetical protein
VPVRYRCKQCGFILYEYNEDIGRRKYWGVPTPSDIAGIYNGVCPRCGRKLNTKPTRDDIIVRLAGKGAGKEAAHKKARD